MAILTLSSYVGILIGPVAKLRIMTGHEKGAAATVGGTVALNVVSNAALIPGWGGTGAAIATAASKLLLSILMACWVIRRQRLNPTIFGRVRASGV